MIIKDPEKTLNEVIELFKSKNTRWQFANGILYDLCKEHPEHNDKDIIVGKMWLIGRSYAAAIERRVPSEKGVDFYYDKVAPRIQSFGQRLDDAIRVLNNSKELTIDLQCHVLEIHKAMVDELGEIVVTAKGEKLNLRSFVSKYLHFHCPSCVFIYDSRARKMVFERVKKDKNTMNPFSGIKCDIEYADYCLRAFELYRFLKDYAYATINPRDLDDYLLRMDDLSL